jgi:hypothetical protein
MIQSCIYNLLKGARYILHPEPTTHLKVTLKLKSNQLDLSLIDMHN